MFYYIAIILYGLSLLCNISGIKRGETIASLCAVITGFSVLVFIYFKTGHFTGYNIFESFLFTSFILGCLSIFSPGVKGYMNKIRRWVWIEILVLMILARIFSEELYTTGFDYNYIYKILFHIFRPLSLAIMLYATAYFLQFILEREFNERTNWLAHMGRNFLLFSAVLFLASEYSGIIWCQQEFGDFWMWNPNFMQSTIIMSYLMLAFHIPGKGKRAEDFRSLIGGLSGIFVITLTILRSFF